MLMKSGLRVIEIILQDILAGDGPAAIKGKDSEVVNRKGNWMSERHLGIHVVFLETIFRVCFLLVDADIRLCGIGSSLNYYIFHLSISGTSYIK